MIVVNLFGAPGAGKSTGAAYVFSKLKMKGINVELVTEFAKDKTWEKNAKALNNQVYMFGKQLFRITKCQDDVDVIVTDSPLFLNVLYNHSALLGEDFNKVVVKIFNSYNNMNYFLTRVKPYNPIGRSQTESESDGLSQELSRLLVKYKIAHKKYEGDKNSYDRICNEVLKELEKNGKEGL